MVKGPTELPKRDSDKNDADKDSSDKVNRARVHNFDTSDTRAQRNRRRSVYVLPNLITTGAMFAGFYAIVAGVNGNFTGAALAIFAAFALDTADGRVARWTKTESAFGAQYDSLSDMVAFGVAPAILGFTWALQSLGQVGWVATFVYMACAALRLARFNSSEESASFTGLASPSAAAIVGCCIWIGAEQWGATPGDYVRFGMAIVMVVSGLLMVSNFRYFSPKALQVKGMDPFLILVLVAVMLAIALADPPRVLMVLFSVYALSGPVMALWRLFKRRSAGQTPLDPP